MSVLFVVILGACTVVGVAGLCATTFADEPVNADLFGTWTLDAALSEPPVMPTRERDEAASPRGGTGRGRGRGGTGRPGGIGGPVMAGGRPSEAERRKAREIMRQALAPPATLTIARAEPAITMTEGDGRVRRIIPTGKTLKQLTGDGEVKVKARWTHGRLSVHTDYGDGIRTTHTYWLDPSGPTRALVMTVKIEHRQLPKSITGTYVYLPATKTGARLFGPANGSPGRAEVLRHCIDQPKRARGLVLCIS